MDRAGHGVAGSAPHAVVAAIPAWGHLGPLVVQAAELARRGWTATVVSSEEMRRHVDGRYPGVTFASAGPMPGGERGAAEVHARASAEPDFALSTMIMTDWALSLWPMMFEGMRAALRARPANVAVVDIASTGALDAADAEHVPGLVNNADLIDFLSSDLVPPADHLPMMFSGRSAAEVHLKERLLAPAQRAIGRAVTGIRWGRKVNALRREQGLGDVDINRRLDDRIVLVNSAFGVEYARPVPPNVQLVGPMLEPDTKALPPEEVAWLEGGPPVVYVNFGTLARPPRDQLLRLAEALRFDDLRVLWVLREDAQEIVKDRTAPSVRLAAWVPSQVALLGHPSVRAFVSHCGINSAYEAIHGGTPVVALPTFVDQRGMALRLRDAGVALVLDKARFTAGELRDAIRRAALDDALRANMPALQSCMRLAGGVRRAADLIEHVARHGASHLLPPGSPRP